MKAEFYLLIAVIDVDGGPAFGGTEWHEKFITKIPQGITDIDLNQALIDQYLTQRHPNIDIMLIRTATGHNKIKIGKHQAWFARQKLPTYLATMMLKERVLPYLNLSASFEKQRDLFAA